MASLIPSSSGVYRVQFRIAGTRHTLSIGRASKSHARTVANHVEHLISHQLSRQPLPPATASWLGEIKGKLPQRLARAGLIVAPATQRAEVVELMDFLERYIGSRSDLKPWSRSNLGRARDALLMYFEPDEDLRRIDKSQIEAWRRWLLQKGYAAASVSGFVSKSRQMFKAAVDAKLIDANPFVGVKAGKQSNPARQRFIPAETIEAVIEKCPDAEWRMIFALARFGGLRVPSETNALKWSDVDFKAGRLRVWSPKTAHHPGREFRVIPLFPVLAKYLREAYDSRKSEHVIGHDSRKSLGELA